MDAIEKFIEEGYTDIIHFPISFKLSSTGPNVVNVANEYADKINVHVVDTKVACYLQGYLAVNAKQMVEHGATVEEILKRSEELIKYSKKQKLKFLEKYINNTVQVLFESYDNGILQGYTRNYIRVKSKGDKSLCGTIQDVAVTLLESEILEGEIMEKTI